MTTKNEQIREAAVELLEELGGHWVSGDVDMMSAGLAAALALPEDEPAPGSGKSAAPCPECHGTRWLHWAGQREGSTPCPRCAP